MRKMKSRLLASGSAAALIALSVASESAAQSEDGGYWAPWAEAEFQFNNDNVAGGVRGFAPVIQTPSGIIFVDAFVGASEGTDIFGSIGVGGRRLVNDRFILGASGFYNISRSASGETFDSVSFGAEALTANFDLRVNYHQVLSEDKLLAGVAGSSSAGSTLSLEGNRLIETTGGIEVFERGYSGIEGEVGAKAPFDLPGDTELRFYAGGFQYVNDLGPTIAGPRGRVELRIFDVFGDSGPLGGARITLAGQITDDNVRGTQGRGEVRFRVPFGGGRKHARRAMSALERRMTERVERDTDVLRVEQTVNTFSSRNAINPATNMEYGLFVFADGANTVGAGTQADPTTFDDGVAKAGAGGVLVAEGGLGVITTSGAMLLNGQTIAGGGASFPVLLENGMIGNFMLSGTNGVVNGTGAGPVITLANNNQLVGFGVTGGSVGVAGMSINNFTLIDMDITSMAGMDLASVTGTGVINNSMITSTAGIGLHIDNTGLMASDFTFSPMNLAIDATGGDAIELDPLTINGSFGPISSDGGFQGIALDEISGSVTFNGPVTISNTTDDGIDIGDGDVDVTFNGPVTITNAGDDALDIQNHSGNLTFNGTFSADMSTNEGLSFDNYTGAASFNGAVTVMNSGDDGMDFDESENATIAFNGVVTIDGAGDDAVEINGMTTGTPTGSIAFNSLLDIDNVSFGLFLVDTLGTTSFNTVDIANTSDDGILVSAGVRVGGSGVSFATLSIDGPSDGIDVFASTTINGAGFTFGNATFSNIGSNAIELIGGAMNAPMTFTGVTTISNPGLSGMQIGNVAGGLTFGDVDITGLGANTTGVDLRFASGAISFATLDITGASNVGTTGIDLTGASNAFNTVTIDSGDITGVNIGVDLTNANLTGIFQYGDGSNTDADGAASTIDAVTPIVFTGLNPGSGVYDFEDVNLIGDTSAFGSASVFWVLEGATGIGTRNDPGSLAAAELAAVDVIVLLNDPTGGDDTLDAMGTNGDDSFTLDDNQRLLSFETTDVFTSVAAVPVNLLVFGVGGDIVNVFTGSGAPTLTTTMAGADTITLGSANELDGLFLTGADSAVFGANIAGIRVENTTVSGVGNSAFDINVISGAQVFENLTVFDPSSIAIAFDFENVSGALMMTNIGISSAGTPWSRGVFVNNSIGATSETLDATLVNVDVSEFFAASAIDFGLDQADGGSISVTGSDLDGSSAAGGITATLFADWTGTLTSLNWSGSTFTGSISNAFDILTVSGASGSITTARFDNNDATAATMSGNGFNLDFASDNASAFTVGTLNITNNQIGTAANRAGDDGIFLDLESSSGSTQSVNITGNTIFAGSGDAADDQAIDINIDAGVFEFAFDNNMLSIDGGAAMAQQALFFSADDADDPFVTITQFSNMSFGAGNEGGLEFYGSVDGAGDATLTFDADTGAGGFQSVDAGSITIGTTGARVQGSGIVLTNVQGTLSFDDLDIANDGGTGLEVDNSAVTAGKDFTLNVDAGDAFSATINTINGTALFLDPLFVNSVFDTITSSGGSNGIFMDGVSGSVVITSADISNTSGVGIDIQNSPATTTLTGANIFAAAGASVSLSGANGAITFGNLTITDPGDRGIEILNSTNNVSINGGSYSSTVAGGGFPVTIQNQVSGTIAFTNFDITGTTFDNNTSDLFNVQNAAGTINVVGGTFSATNANDIVDITGGSATINIGATISQVGTDASFANAVEIDGVTGGSITFGGNISQTGSGNAVEIGVGAANTGGTVTFNGTVNQTTNFSAINIQNNSGGTFDFNGAVTSNTTSATGVNLVSNTGATINFDGGLDIDATSGIGFNATGGGTLNITGTNTVNTATGQILNLNGMTIGGSGATFSTLAASGAVGTTAINLNNVDGGAFSGGNVTVAGATGDGIFIGGGSNATFNFASATIDNVTDDGIDISGAGNGAVTFTTVDIDGAGGGGVEITSNDNAVNINGGTIGSTNDPAGDAVNINGGSGDVTIAASVTKTTSNNVVQVINRTGGTVTISGNLSATGGANNGISVTNNTGGTITFSGGTKTISTGANTAVNLATNAGATINFTGGGLDIDTTSGQGFNATGGGTINVTGAGNTINTATGQILNMSGVIIGGSGATFATLGASGTIASTAINLNNVDSGTFNGGNVSIAGTSVGDGIFIGGGSSGTFNFTSATIDNVADDSIDLDGSGNGVITFTTVDLDGAAGGGLEINNNTNAVNINGGSIGSTNDPAGDAVNINGGGGNVTIAASITKTTTNNVLQVLNRTGGTVTVSGNLSATGNNNNGIDIQNNSAGTINITGGTKTISTGGNTAVNLNNNTNATINFTGGGLDIDTTTGDGFRATGGGTITLQGSNNTVNTTTGHGVFIQNTTIGANDVTFASVSTNGLGGGTTGGIFVENTGSVAGSAFVVNGGTIQNAEGASLASGAMSANGDGIGVYLEGVQNVTLSGLTVTGSDNFGIRGFNLSGTTNFTSVTVNGNHGDTAASDEAAVALDNITGTLNVTNGAYGGGHEDTFAINNTSGSLTANFSGVTINANQSTTGDNGLQFVTSGTATGNLNVNGSAFTGARSVMLFVDLGGSGGGTVNIGNTSQNTFTQNQTNLPGGGAIEVLASGSGNTATVNTTINNNLILAGTNTFEGDTIVVGTGFGFAGTLNATITNNIVGSSGMNGSAVNPLGAQGDNGIVLSMNGTGDVTALIDGNQIFDYNTDGIEIIFDAEGPSVPTGGTLNLNITNNTIDDALGDIAAHGIQVIGSDNVDACIAITGNTVDNPLGRDIEIDVFETGGSGFYRVPGLVTLTEAGIDAFYTAANTITAPADVTVFSMTGYTITGSAGCTTP